MNKKSIIEQLKECVDHVERIIIFKNSHSYTDLDGSEVVKTEIITRTRNFDADECIYNYDYEKDEVEIFIGEYSIGICKNVKSLIKDIKEPIILKCIIYL